jgi:FkbM family methyltransferase
VTPRAVRIGSRVIRVADDQPTFWDRVEAGQWEPETLAAIDGLVDSRTTFLDLGAWVGPTTLYAAGIGRHIVAVEADPAALDQLRRNLAVNPDLAERIEVVPRAVHAHEGSVGMGARRKPGDSMSSVLLAGCERTWEAATVTPGELAAMTADAERLIVKIDIEGAEYDLLPSLAPLLERAHAILISFHPKILDAALSNKRDAARRTRAALAALASFQARPLAAKSGASRAPLLVRWRLRRELPGDDWLFIRR